MKLHDLYSKYIKSSESLLLEFSPAKTESLVTHFKQKHPDYSDEVVKFVVKRFSELLNSKKPDGTDLLRADRNQRDIDAIIAADNDDGWGVIYDIVYNFTKPSKLPEELTKIPGIPELIIDSNGIKVWKANTKTKCEAIRQLIQTTPGLRESFASLTPNEQNMPGAHRYGWCVTFAGNPHYFGYREGQHGHPHRTFYFVYDENRPVTDLYHMSVVQPFLTPFVANNISYPMLVTNVVNGGDLTMTFAQLEAIYPSLANHRDLIKYIPTHTAEAQEQLLMNKRYEDLDPVKRVESETYLYRWYALNPTRPIPIERFLQLSQDYQNSFIRSRSLSLFYSYNVYSPFTSGNRYTNLPLFTALSQIIRAGKTGIARNITGLYNSLPNARIIQVDSNNNPILDFEGAVNIIATPVIVEKLPTSKKVVYASENSIYTYEKNAEGAYTKVAVNKDTLQAADKKFVEEIEAVLRLIAVATVHF